MIPQVWYSCLIKQEHRPGLPYLALSMMSNSYQNKNDLETTSIQEDSISTSSITEEELFSSTTTTSPYPMILPLDCSSIYTDCGYCKGHSCSHHQSFYLFPSSSINCSLADASALYERFLDAGFRRSGRMLYKPFPDSCCQLRALRVEVEKLEATKSQRKAINRFSTALHHIDRINLGILKEQDNALLIKNVVYPCFLKYQEHVHGDAHEWSLKRVKRFLLDSPLSTTELHLYYINDHHRNDSYLLIAGGVVDMTPVKYLSSVYFFYDPNLSHRHNLSPGTAGALMEIDYARKLGLKYYTLGYWLSSCPKLEYKARFGTNNGACEIFKVVTENGQWEWVELTPNSK